jgi:hypothetical protein
VTYVLEELCAPIVRLVQGNYLEDGRKKETVFNYETGK